MLFTAHHQRRFAYVMNHTIEQWGRGFLENLDRATQMSSGLTFMQVSGDASLLAWLACCLVYSNACLDMYACDADCNEIVHRSVGAPT